MTDSNSLNFCKACVETFDADLLVLNQLWEVAKTGTLTQMEALELWDKLFRVSHARIVRGFGERLASYYPTPKRRPNQLDSNKPLWWVIHSTGGVSLRPVVVWFSGQRRPGKDGKLTLRGGSTHFAIEHDGTPWCFIRPTDSAWHCRQRNRDGLSVELVNACALSHHIASGGEEFYRWWNGRYRLPYEPVHLSKAFRRRNIWQPYDERQLVSLIVMMRMANAATGWARHARERVTTHTDWNPNKLDCGPLFPMETVVEAVFSQEPIDQIDWVQSYTQPDHPAWDDDTQIDATELLKLMDHAIDIDEHMTSDEDEEQEDTNPVGTMMQVQEVLAALGYYSGRIDGIFGPLTKAATKAFQNTWNATNNDDRVKVDGIPGPQTKMRLSKQLAFR
jgi:N-acetyl-anhydromuramyl-L-alanine amidase AmpD